MMAMVFQMIDERRLIDTPPTDSDGDGTPDGTWIQTSGQGDGDGVSR